MLLALSAAPCLADRFDDFIQAKMSEQHIPGLQFVVTYRGKVAMSRSYGFANTEKKEPVTKDTRFEVASISKPVIATAVMMLWEEGKFKLTDAIGAYVKDLPVAWGHVPIRQILSHTSGIPEFRGSDLYFSKRMEDVPFADIAKSLPEKLEFDPGDHFEYSNTNYLLAGKLIEAVTGKPWTDFLRARIFTPLAMTATGFVGSQEHAQGYVGSRPARDCSLTWAGPGSSIVSTAEDMAKFDAALTFPKLIKGATYSEMLQPTLTKLGPMDYGIGWQVAKVGPNVMALHSGKMNGFSSMYLRVLDQQIGVIVLTNAGDIDGNAIARGILGLYFPELDPAKPMPIVDDDPATTKRHQSLFVTIIRGEPDMDAFTLDYKAHVGEEKLKAVGAELRRNGPIRPFKLVKRYADSRFRVSVYLVAQGQAQILVTMFDDDKGKVAGLTLGAP